MFLMKLEVIDKEVQEHILVLEQSVKQLSPLIIDLVESLSNCFRRGNKLMICGNGGSAADAQHVAAEFVNRFRFDRKPLPAIALTTDSSVLTSIGNDYGFENVFSRQIRALGNKGDVLVVISTSGRSENILNAIDAAAMAGIITIGFTGEKGRDSMGERCDCCLVIPSTDTARIQECHAFVWHLICGMVEAELCG
jgi:D-sedoheptulose 7-phosphate isomerase